MIAPASPPTGTVDLTAIRRGDFRDRLRVALRDLDAHLEESSRFWDDFGTSVQRGSSDGTLVLADLSELARAFQEEDLLSWTTKIRRSRPFFLAFVRTGRDRACATRIADLLRASDLRMNICHDASDPDEIARSLSTALAALRPESLTEVWYLRAQDALLLRFSDGLVGSVSWTDLGIADLRGRLIAESATVGPTGNAIQLATTRGNIFDIDGASARSILDATFRDELRGLRSSEEEVGARVRAARRRAGITQAELSQRTGLDQAVISRMERGRHQPRIDSLRRVADGLGVSLSAMLRAGPANHADARPTS